MICVAKQQQERRLKCRNTLGGLHTQNTASAPSHPIQHPTAGMGTHMTPVGCVMAGCCQIEYILTNIGRKTPFEF